MIIDGKKIASAIQDEIQKKIASLQARKPGLAFILVGKNSASLTYVQAKKKACAQVGIESKLIELEEDTSYKALLLAIDKLNQDKSVDGILVQFPLPSSFDKQKVSERIDPRKDVDGFHPLNLGKLLLGETDGFVSCTPLGIQKLLEASHVNTAGKHVVIVGRSNIVGKPLAALLVQKKEHANATVTIAHSQTINLQKITSSADILIACMGHHHFIRKEHVKPRAVVIDVGIHRSSDGKIEGDVKFDEVFPIASKITPVPGGVGPMTIAMLLQNTYLSYERNKC